MVFNPTPNRPKLSGAAQRLVDNGTSTLVTAAGAMILRGDDAGIQTRSETLASVRGRFPQLTRWPLPGSGELHPLDYIKIAGVILPLAEPPEYSIELSISERHSSGTDWETLVSHGRKSSPVRIKLKLWRDVSLGYDSSGHPKGKDWFAEYDKIGWTLIPAKFDKRGAVPVEYPTLQRLGCDSVVFTRQPTERRLSGGFWTVELEGRNPRAVKFGGSGSHKIDQQKDFGTRANAAPVTLTDKQVKKGSEFFKAVKQSAQQPPSASKKGK